MGNRLAAALIVACCAVAAPSEARASPHWAVDPSVTGSTLPPAGRSLFDLIIAGDVPFPFELLVRRIEQRIGCAPGACTSAVLIPLGRSLQRTAAAPDFFASPRIVLAVTAEGRGPMVAKDRLYLGYQERGDLLEVISYNEAAGRFEFQIVRNYRTGGFPQVVYANRAVCTACHQNQAPIFSRQIWDETNANAEVAARLERSAAGDPLPGRLRFHGMPIRSGVETPNAIDDSTEHANLVGVTQRLWREACDSACRAQALTAALQYRLSGERGFAARPAVKSGFAALWPTGLAIPNPDLPNRNPLDFPSGASGAQQVDIAAGLEPIAARSPAAVWSAEDAALEGRFVAGLGALISDGDVRELEQVLAARRVQRGSAVRRRTLRAECSIEPDRVSCAGDFVLNARSTTINELIIDARPLTRLKWNNGDVMQESRRARSAAGDLIERLELVRNGATGVATLTLAEDFTPMRAVIAAATWPAVPFDRAQVRATLGLGTLAPDTARLPPPREDRVVDAAEDAATARSSASGAASLPAFYAQCATCHRTPERSPPNFLAGDDRQVNANLAQCAPRMFVRLSMWQQPAEERAKVPMPPPRAARDGKPWIQSEPDASISSLRALVAAWLRAESGREPDLAWMLARGYESLRPCLPAAN